MAYKEIYLDGVYFVNAFLVVRNGNKDLIEEQGDVGAFTYKDITASDKDKIVFRYSVFNNSSYSGYREILQSFEVEAYPDITLEDIDEGVFYLTDDLSSIRVDINDNLYDQSYGIRSGLDHPPVGYLYRDKDGEIHNIGAYELICPTVEVGYTGTSSGITEMTLSGIYNYSSITDALGQVYSTTKIFKTVRGANKYLETGNDDDDVNEGDKEPAKDRITTLFYASDIYSRAYNDSTLSRVGASTIYIDIQYANNDGTVIVDKHRAICGYVNTDNEINDRNHFGNIIWMAAPNTKIIETKQSWLNGGHSLTKTLPNFANTTGFYPPLVDGSTIYESRYNTNMFIFANRQDAEAFLLGNNPKPIGGGGTGPFSPDKLVGDETEYNLHSAQLHNDMSSCWILSGSAVNELASIFATGVKQDTSNPDSAATVFESCIRGLAAHGEPIDMVCDLFWLPIDPTEFCSSESGTITVSRDSYGLLTAVKDISDEFGEHYKVSTAMNYNWVLGPAGQSLYTLNAIKESIQSVIGEEETSNKLHVGTHHDQSPIQ